MDQDFPAQLQYPKPVRKILPSRELREAIRNEPVPSDSAALWHLGQNGFLLRDKEGPVMAVDPYLTDYCASGWSGERNGKSRFLPVFLDPEDLEIQLLLLTHSHCDHADPFTLKRIPNKDQITVLAPWAAAQTALAAGFSEKNIRIVHPGETLTCLNLEITVTFSLPTDATDLCHVGFFIRFPNGKTFYNTGDTAQSPLIAPSVPRGVDLMTVCINSGYNNLGYYQAAELVRQIGPRYAAPTHYDTMPHNFQPPSLFLSAVARSAPDVQAVIIPYYTPFLF